MQKLTTYTLGKTIIEKVFDDNPDISHLGEYTCNYKPGCIVRYDKSFYEDHMNDDDYDPPYYRNEYPFFMPPENGYPFDTPEYKKYALEDYNLMEGLNNNRWWFIGIIVSTQIHTDNEISYNVTESLYGVEDGLKESEKYQNEVIADLMHEIKTKLLKMSFSDEEIEETFEDKQVVELA